MSKWRIGSFLATITFLGIVILAALNIERIQDTISYHRYEPSGDIAAFVDKTGMNEKGRFLFYASQPSLENATDFNTHCESREKTTAILGCYDGHRIYIYNVSDSRLEGIRSTTAAHEMLHAAYKRLSDSDRRMVNKLLEAEYQKLKNNEDLADRMAFYARTQPGERENELHSIIGTEIEDISDELEDYYSRYFSDRSKVVAERQKYFAVFEELRERADNINSQLDTLGKRISENRAAYSAQSASLQRDINSFNARAESGDFASQADFRRERQSLVVRSSTLESLRVSLNNDISKYNQLVNELDDIATETSDLNRSIDSNIEPAPSL